MEELLKDQLGHLDLTGRVLKNTPMEGVVLEMFGVAEAGQLKLPSRYPSYMSAMMINPWKWWQRCTSCWKLFMRHLLRLSQEACREIHIWSRLCHTNILPLLGFYFDFSSVVSPISPWMINGTAIEFLLKNCDLSLTHLVGALLWWAEFWICHNLIILCSFQVSYMGFTIFTRTKLYTATCVE